MYQLADHSYGIRLSTLLPNARISGGKDITFTSCCADWQQCQPGDLFIAIETAESDGHQHVERAIERGAIGVVAERLLPSDQPICVVDDSREAYARICQAIMGNPSRQMHAIAVTGTSGKTITAHLLQSILCEAGIPTGIMATNACSAETIKPNGSEFGYSPPELAKGLAEMQASGIQAVVIEVPSQALAQRYLGGITFESVVTTNLKPNHLKFHGSEENYLRAKRRIFDHVADHGLAIFDADDRESIKSIEQWTLPALTISLEDRGELNAYLIERHLGEQSFLISAGDESVAVECKSIGDAYIRCAMLAAATALSMGVELTTIARGIEKVTKISGRMEPIVCGQPFSVFVDRAQTPDELAQALRSLREVTAGRLICVYGSKSCMPKADRATIGRFVERYADLGVITSDDPNCEQPLAISHDILDGYRRVSRDHVIPDRREAIRFALDSAQPGDIVLVAGKGDQATQLINGTEWLFDDRAECKEILYQRDETETPNIVPDLLENDPMIFPIQNYRRPAR